MIENEIFKKLEEKLDKNLLKLNIKKNLRFRKEKDFIL